MLSCLDLSTTTAHSDVTPAENARLVAWEIPSQQVQAKRNFGVFGIVKNRQDSVGYQQIVPTTTLMKDAQLTPKPNV